MSLATRALSMVRAALQWMSLLKILNYQSWKWASGCSFQVSTAVHIAVTKCMHAHTYVHIYTSVSMCIISRDYCHMYMHH